MVRLRTFMTPLAAAIAAAAGVAIIRHLRHHSGRQVPGGVLIGDADLYDRLSHRLLLNSLFAGIAADVAAVAPDRARVLEVGCGPGHLSIRMARRHGLDVTGLDLDPAMIERARANVGLPRDGEKHRPSFLVGDVASLPYPDRSFDLVVSTLSTHHWADPTAGLAEIGRVLHPEGRALIWDLRPGVVPIHRRLPDPTQHAHGSRLRIVSATPWHWPWRFTLTQRIELAHAHDAPPERSESNHGPPAP